LNRRARRQRKELLRVCLPYLQCFV
jgi:hypothetical protein